MRLLAEVARERQIFLFTCHARMADAAIAVGATRLSLPQVSASSDRSSGADDGSNPAQRSTGSAG